MPLEPLRLALSAAVLIGLAAVPGDGQAPAPAPSHATLKYGTTASVLEDTNPSDALAATTVWLRGVGRAVGTWNDAEGTLVTDVTSLPSAVASGTADVLVASTLEYLSVERSLNADPVLVYVVRGEILVEYVLVVRNGVTSIRDLAGKRVAVREGSAPSNLADLWLDVLALEAGLPERDRAFNLQPTKRASQAVLAAFFGQADAAVVARTAFETQVALNPQIGKTVTILARSPRLLPAVVCASRSMDRGVLKRWTEKALTLHEDARLAQTYVLLKIDRLAAWDPKYMESSRLLIRQHAALKRSAGGR